jgi:lysophosphatidylcholine acyltransferase/lyso-PAF acetyltransferase
MLQFHIGAFIPGAPVQIVVQRYKYKNFCPGWVGNSEKFYFSRLFSQVNNSLCLVHFPPYFPSEAERLNPVLYANNVRQMMIHLSNKYLEPVCGEMEDSHIKFVRKVH